MALDFFGRVAAYGQVIQVVLGIRIRHHQRFSAHADQAEQLAWHKQTGKLERTSLIHGEEEVMSQLATHLNGIEIVMPALNEIFNI